MDHTANITFRRPGGNFFLVGQQTRNVVNFDFATDARNIVQERIQNGLASEGEYMIAYDSLGTYGLEYPTVEVERMFGSVIDGLVIV